MADTTKKPSTTSNPPEVYQPLRGTDNTIHSLSTVVQQVRRQYHTIKLKKGENEAVIIAKEGADAEGAFEDPYRYAVVCLGLALFAGRGTMKDGAILWLDQHKQYFGFMDEITVVFDPINRGGAEKYEGTWKSMLSTVLSMADWVKESTTKYPLPQKATVVSKPKEGKKYIDLKSW